MDRLEAPLPEVAKESLGFIDLAQTTRTVLEGQHSEGDYPRARRGREGTREAAAAVMEGVRPRLRPRRTGGLVRAHRTRQGERHPDSLAARPVSLGSGRALAPS